VGFKKEMNTGEMVKTRTSIILLLLLLVVSKKTSLSGERPTGVARPNAATDSVTTSSWSVVIKAKLGMFSDSLATLGVKPDATPLYDPAYDVPHPPEIGDYLEVYFPHSGDNWPPIWGSRYAFDFTSPLTPNWIFSVETNLAPGTLTLSWDTSRINSLPSTYPIVMKDSTTGVQMNMRTQNSYSFQYSGPRLFVVRADAGATVYNLSSGWNLISLPRLAADSSKFVLFSNAISPAYTYNGQYIVQNMLRNGTGYWLRFRDQQTVVIPGLGIPSLDVSVSTGWNLVGSVDGGVPAPRDGPILSRWFEYDGGYQAADTLRAGRGYWVKVSASGTIHIGPLSSSTEKSSFAAPPGTSTLIDVRDRENGHQQLRLCPGEIPAGEIAHHELPPVPSAGAFDARFTTQRFQENYGSSLPARFVVQIQSDAYPVTVQARPADPDLQLLFRDPVSGTVLGSSGTASSGVLVLRNPDIRQVEVTIFSSKHRPSEFYLQQNYPNPFNPASIIRYSLAGQSRIRLSLTDAVGRELGVLDEGMREAGIHEITVDGTAYNLSTGMYLYRLEGVDATTSKLFTATRKLLFLK
jgi:hypothetical protein